MSMSRLWVSVLVPLAAVVPTAAAEAQTVAREAQTVAREAQAVAGDAGTAVADALIAVRVKTAIVNDAAVGELPIEVHALRGVVTLEGIVRAPDQADRAVALAERVPGVARVESALVVGDPDPLAEQRRPRLPALAPRPTEGPMRLLAAGATMRLNRAPSAFMDRMQSIRPVFRFGSSTGFGPSVSFRGGEAALDPTGGTQTALAAVRLRPVMAGLNYNLVRRRVTVGAGVVAGYAFNSLNVETARAGPGRAIAVTNSFVVQPKVDVWFDVTRRVGLTLQAGYLVSRPKVTFGSDDVVTTERVRVNTVVVSAGLA
ncbi:MAG: BON domain-containing protein, partial [Chloroflexi bacterium]|nr:BON domain-containing protein [Chloroflexota bacterium]